MAGLGLISCQAAKGREETKDFPLLDNEPPTPLWAPRAPSPLLHLRPVFCPSLSLSYDGSPAI